MTSPWGGVMKFSILVSLSFRCYILNLVKVSPVILEKMLTHDARGAMDDDGRQPIATGHLSDSGELKTL